MDKYKLCPGCGHHNDPIAIECADCGEDLSAVRILDAQTEQRLQEQSAPEKTPPVRMVRICEECGTCNEANSRKCKKCGEDLSAVIPVPEKRTDAQFCLSALDGTYSYTVPAGAGSVTVGREAQMQEYLSTKLYVSRQHAELLVQDGILSVRSLPSAANGTFNGKRQLQSGEFVPISVGDVIGFGGNDPETQKEAAYFRVMQL